MKDGEGNYMEKSGIAAEIAVGVGILAATTFALYWFTHSLIKTADYDQKLYIKTMAKADTNKDGVLQNEELAGLLKKLGNEFAILDNKNISIDVGKRTWVYGNWPGIKVYLGRKDLEQYLRDN